MSDSVTIEDVKDVALSFRSPTLSYLLGLVGYSLLVRMVKEQGLMSAAYIPETITFLGIILIIVTGIMLFVWGFVVYMFLQYLIDSKGESYE